MTSLVLLDQPDAGTLPPAATPPFPRPLAAELACIADELSRRGFLAGGMSAAALAGLAACGSPAPAPGPAASATRKVTADNGTVNVPARPKRIITLDTWSLNACLDLGATMVGTVNDAPVSVPPQFAAAAGALPVVSAGGTVNLEQIAALKPDLILTIFLSKETLPDLEKIAPVVVRQNTDFASTEDYFAGVLGRAAQLTTLRRAYGQQVTSIRSAYRSLLAAKRWAIAAPLADQVYVYHQLSTGGKVLTDLGARWSAAAAPGTSLAEDGALLSYEQLGRLADADVILNTDSGEPGTRQKFTGNPIVKSLPAAKAGHVFDTTYAYPQSYGQAVQFLDLIEDILRQLS